jgi:hypothetical protein
MVQYFVLASSHHTAHSVASFHSTLNTSPVTLLSANIGESNPREKLPGRFLRRIV